MSVTFHPGCTKVRRDGKVLWLPRIILRDASGHTVKVFVVHSEQYTDKAAARNHARWSAHRSAEGLPFARVA